MQATLLAFRRERHCELRIVNWYHPVSCENKGSPRLTGKAGLGLSIVKHLTEGMEGKIAILSKPGYGSTFILTLPALGAKI